MKYTKKFILIFAISLVLLSCSNMPTGTREALKLKERAGRYLVNGNFDKDIELNFIIFETGNINFIGSKADKANNLGTYVLGNPESTNKTFSFDIKETINGVAPNTYFIDFLYSQIEYSTNKVLFRKSSDSTNIKVGERIGVYYNQNKDHKITVSENKIEWSYFTDAYIDISDIYSEENTFTKTQIFTNENNEEHSFSLNIVFTDNACKLTFNITDPNYSQYNKSEEEYRISWE
ncbi:hypothetical protein BFL38_10475 [Brachyspira hampsonii]|uniref:Lipoprotein n=1 Tax=Brachyspira hampsonii TaxID=1287055 RepID=A0A1E5NID3_9SPIR|nr:hypothetical protein [Brachyspira hampsonii]OEJ15876.1 hypothetical protein BFL38_10475 [Brachyspira hampsonii]